MTTLSQRANQIIAALPDNISSLLIIAMLQPPQQWRELGEPFASTVHG